MSQIKRRAEKGEDTNRNGINDLESGVERDSKKLAVALSSGLIVIYTNNDDSHSTNKSRRP